MNKTDFGIKDVRRLPVSGAFHTPLMKSAVRPLSKALSKVEFKKPLVHVHANCTGYRYTLPQVGKLLTQQLTEPVRLEQTLHTVYSRPDGDDFPHTFEVGPGKQLGLFIRKTNRKAFANYESVSV